MEGQLRQYVYSKISDQTVKLELQRDPQFLESTSLVRVAPGQILFQQGEKAEACFLVLSGSLSLVARTDGNERILTIISQGEFGGILLVEKEFSDVFPGSVIGLVSSVVLILPKDLLRTRWRQNTTLSQFINQSIQARMKSFQVDKILETMSIEKRVAHFFFRHFIQKKDLINKKVTRKQIAMLVGSKTETVIRAIRQFEKEGIVKSDGSIYTIEDEALLRLKL